MFSLPFQLSAIRYVAALSGYCLREKARQGLGMERGGNQRQAISLMLRRSPEPLLTDVVSPWSIWTFEYLVMRFFLLRNKFHHRAHKILRLNQLNPVPVFTPFLKDVFWYYCPNFAHVFPEDETTKIHVFLTPLCPSHLFCTHLIDPIIIPEDKATGGWRARSTSLLTVFSF